MKLKVRIKEQIRVYAACTLLGWLTAGCSKEKAVVKEPVLPVRINTATINGRPLTNALQNIGPQPEIRLSFSRELNPATLNAITMANGNGANVALTAGLETGDTTVVIRPSAGLAYLEKYTLTVSTGLKAVSGEELAGRSSWAFATGIDSIRKFPVISENALMDTVQRRTLQYFLDFAHPSSGMIREGSKHPSEIVTTGGTGFGIMALLVGIERGFITKAAGLQQTNKIVTFLKNTAQTFHGAYPHWLNGATGAVIPFGANDNGADLVETAFLVQGLICARQYFNGSGMDEINLRSDISAIIDKVEWNWFRQNNQQVLYWHWSSDKGWAMNLKIQGWNECLISYVLAAGSKSYAIPKTAYDEGWAKNGEIKNGKTFYSYILPLGADYGGPLFFAHYSFLGLNPNGLSDLYANYLTQNKNHALINYAYCKANPGNYYGYSDSVWGLTASNIKGGYAAGSPANDQGFIAPTAALSSFPYTPKESMAALQFYYYVLGDKIWKQYGFVDAFSLDVLKNNGAWFDDAFLAIDQGPIVVMMENYRTGLLWRLFMSAPEVQNGLQKLGFTF
ncbi:Ig-like domain-containing protein [Niabella sp. CC-SYL272]|uniref:glucoamylase family protein n=1 Tax=Niabella agricola TaxID=2891571 RepID=UPI001F477DE0|nr:glucoamylase family protein [Niabella agricola]MCF3110820.1 Ig-like domain-containing protein [Niabella agricola]